MAFLSPPPPHFRAELFYIFRLLKLSATIQNMQALNQVFIPSINNNEQITCLLMKQMKQTNLNLPFHSEHRHNVHKQRGYICTQCYRCVDRQGQQAVIPQGGITSGVRGLTLPPASGEAGGKKITAWNGRDIQYILLHKKHHFKNTW